MNREWLEEGAAVPVTCEVVTELIAEIKRLIDVGSGMALAQPDHIVGVNKMVEPQRPWIGLTNKEATILWENTSNNASVADIWELIKGVEATLKGKNT